MEGKQERVPGKNTGCCRQMRECFLTNHSVQRTYSLSHDLRQCQSATAFIGHISRHPNAINLFFILQKMFPKNFKKNHDSRFCDHCSSRSTERPKRFLLSTFPSLSPSHSFFSPYYSHAPECGLECHHHKIWQDVNQGDLSLSARADSKSGRSRNSNKKA